MGGSVVATSIVHNVVWETTEIEEDQGVSHVVTCVCSVLQVSPREALRIRSSMRRIFFNSLDGQEAIARLAAVAGEGHPRVLGLREELRAAMDGR